MQAFLSTSTDCKYILSVTCQPMHATMAGFSYASGMAHRIVAVRAQEVPTERCASTALVNVCYILCRLCVDSIQICIGCGLSTRAALYIYRLCVGGYRWLSVEVPLWVQLETMVGLLAGFSRTCCNIGVHGCFAHNVLLWFHLVRLLTFDSALLIHLVAGFFTPLALKDSISNYQLITLQGSFPYNLCACTLSALMLHG